MDTFTDIIKEFIHKRNMIPDVFDPSERIQAHMELVSETITKLVQAGMTSDLASTAVLGAVQGLETVSQDETASDTEFWKDKRAIGRNIN